MPQSYNFFYSGASPGSGKTWMAARYIEANPTKNILYIVPTMKLAMGVRAEIESAASTKRFIRNINSSTTSLRARDKALNVINSVYYHVGKIIILTYQNFLRIAADIKRPEIFDLIFDESFDVITMKPFRSFKRSNIITDFFKIDDKTKLATKQYGKADIFNSIYHFQNYSEVDELRGAQKFVDAVVNPCTELHLRQPVTGNAWYGFTVTTPDVFTRFNSLLVMSALFERSLLKQIWEIQFDVTWTEHPFWADIGNVTHTRFGSNVQFGYMLPDGVNPSRTLMERTYADGTTVLDVIIKKQAKFFKNVEYIATINRYGISALLFTGFPRCNILPGVSNGQNGYSHFHNVAVIAVGNNRPELADMIKILLKGRMSVAEIQNLVRRERQHQDFCRCSIRDRNSIGIKKTIIVNGEKDAKYFNKLFMGSRLLGRVANFDVPITDNRTVYPEYFNESKKRRWRRYAKPIKDAGDTPQTPAEWDKQQNTVI